jgi:hypothetical protein
MDINGFYKKQRLTAFDQLQTTWIKEESDTPGSGPGTADVKVRKCAQLSRVER